MHKIIVPKSIDDFSAKGAKKPVWPTPNNTLREQKREKVTNRKK
jgi:hypothetical protein